MKTEYRIIKKDIYEFLQYRVVMKLFFIIFIQWRYIPNANNPSNSPVARNRYITNDNTDLNAFINKYNNVLDYLKKDYPVLKEKSLQEFGEFKHEARTSF